LVRPSKSSGQYIEIIYYHHLWLIITLKGYSNIRSNRLTLIPGVTPVVVDAVSGYEDADDTGGYGWSCSFCFSIAAGCFRSKGTLKKVSSTTTVRIAATTTAFHCALCRSKLSTLALNLLAQLNEVYTWLIYAKSSSYLRRTFIAAHAP